MPCKRHTNRQGKLILLYKDNYRLGKELSASKKSVGELGKQVDSLKEQLEKSKVACCYSFPLVPPGVLCVLCVLCVVGLFSAIW